MKIIQSTLLYNYYILALQKWCSVDYKIHGLWGDVDSTHYPSYCSTISLDSIELKKSPKYDELKEKWYDCTIEDIRENRTNEIDKKNNVEVKDIKKIDVIFEDIPYYTLKINIENDNYNTLWKIL